MYVIFSRCISTWKGSSKQSLWMILDNMTSIVFVLIPFIVILVTTVCILSFLKKKSTLRRQNVALILSVSVLHLISCMPFLLYIVVMNSLKPSSEVKYRNSTVAQLYAAANFVNYLNTMCNPVLYYFTSASFSAYIREHSRRLLGRVRRVGVVDTVLDTTRSVSASEKESRKVDTVLQT